jgi:hypothetical protein
VERWEHIEQIFHEALQLDSTQREAYVRDVCRGDSGAFRKVSSLLASYGEAGGFEPWAANAAAQLIVERVSLLPGECLGPYRIDSFLQWDAPVQQGLWRSILYSNCRSRWYVQYEFPGHDL